MWAKRAWVGGGRGGKGGKGGRRGGDTCGGVLKANGCDDGVPLSLPPLPLPPLSWLPPPPLPPWRNAVASAIGTTAAAVAAVAAVAALV